MKSFQPTFPWADNTNHDNIVKLIETLGLTDTDVVIRLEDLEGLRAALQDFASRPNILNEVAELEDEVEYLKDELRSFENESAYQEDHINALENENHDLRAKLEELESDPEF